MPCAMVFEAPAGQQGGRAEAVEGQEVVLVDACMECMECGRVLGAEG